MTSTTTNRVTTPQPSTEPQPAPEVAAPTPVVTVGIAGTGIMGSGIAEVAALAGFDVTIRSRRQSRAEEAQARLATSLDRQVEKGKLDATERDRALARVRTTSDIESLAGCDLVVESVVEDLDVKRQLFAQLDQVCSNDTILATNTSTLAVTDVAMATERPDRVVGLHFFNPAPRMPLVEVVPAAATDRATVDAARRFAEDCGKETVTVKDNAGFVVNALLFPYLNGAVKMLDAGVASREDIDTAMKGGCGYPMGPLELLDLIGLDTSVSIMDALHADRPDACLSPAPLLKRMVTAGQLGRKSGTGFYDYSARH